MGYISLSDKDKKEMLARIGISSVDDLFRPIPEDLRLKQKLDVPGPLSEPELMDHFRDIAKRNTYHRYVSFLGGGAYPHFIPAVVDYLSSRGEFVTPYTPYQPEVSQGTLQAIFEFQTLICQLTGMDIANASLYDGASGAAEAVLMAFRQKNRAKVLVSRALNPQYREVIQTYSRNLELSVEEVAFSDQGTTDIRDLRGR
ncbi:MAG: glycine dehydrogenase, partial [Candidatus Aminicenantales bacterium]